MTYVPPTHFETGCEVEVFVRSGFPYVHIAADGGYGSADRLRPNQIPQIITALEAAAALARGGTA